MAEAKPRVQKEADRGSGQHEEPKTTAKVGDREQVAETPLQFKCPKLPRRWTAEKAAREAKPVRTPEIRPDNRQRLLRRQKRRAAMQ